MSEDDEGLTVEKSSVWHSVAFGCSGTTTTSPAKTDCVGIVCSYMIGCLDDD